ncbi:MAG: hypothetical protein Ct9H300mP14_00100 [Gammaproteobacteria bacterium]|nr:MAG: hypothetical protein Ct9H300mP14_00100 [Gammaproteobacteria bacterium]
MDPGPASENSFAKSVTAYSVDWVYSKSAVKRSGFAERLGFNREMKSDVEISASRLALNLDDPFGLS